VRWFYFFRLLFALDIRQVLTMEEWHLRLIKPVWQVFMFAHPIFADSNFHTYPIQAAENSGQPGILYVCLTNWMHPTSHKTALVDTEAASLKCTQPPLSIGYIYINAVGFSLRWNGRTVRNNQPAKWHSGLVLPRSNVVHGITSQLNMFDSRQTIKNNNTHTTKKWMNSKWYPDRSD
jgi:hypothetical protein